VRGNGDHRRSWVKKIVRCLHKENDGLFWRSALMTTSLKGRQTSFKTMLDGQRKFSLGGVAQQRGCSGNRSDDACAVCFASGVMVGPDQTEKKVDVPQM